MDINFHDIDNSTLIIYNTVALVGSDYIGVNSNQVFSSGSTNNSTRCVDIFIVDFYALEGDETFTLILTSSDPGVMLGNDLTTILIIDYHG